MLHLFVSEQNFLQPVKEVLTPYILNIKKSPRLNFANSLTVQANKQNKQNKTKQT